MWGGREGVGCEEVYQEGARTVSEEQVLVWECGPWGRE